MQVTSNTVVCSAHFKAEDYITVPDAKRAVLCADAVPSVFEWSSTKPYRKPPTHREPPSAAAGAPTPSTSFSAASGGLLDDPTGDIQPTAHAPASCDVDYVVEGQSVDDKLEAAQQRIIELESELAESVRISRFGLERFSASPNMIKFYTGFPTYEGLLTFFRCIALYVSNMITWAQVQRRSSSSLSAAYSFGSKLQPFDQFFLFLHKLRVGSLDQDLADKFNISVPTVSRTVITWANSLYVILGSQCIWPTREQIKKYMPTGFKALYPDTRVVIDCTEIAIQCPSSMVLRSAFYSSYKGRTTLKCLIGVTPSGAVSFISALYAGSISDKHITKVSGLLDLLEPGDLVMADKGFLISDLLSPLQCYLVTPNFLARKKQFSSAEAQHNKMLSNLRVHVERANRRFKEYHLFDTPVPLALAGSVNQLWCVACLLSNFQGPIIVNL